MVSEQVLELVVAKELEVEVVVAVEVELEVLVLVEVLEPQTPLPSLCTHLLMLVL